MYRGIVIAALIALISLGACTKEEKENPYASPEETVRAYAGAMTKGDYEAALDCYADSALSASSVGVVGLSPAEIRSLFLKSLANSAEPYVKNKVTNLKSRYMTAEVTYELGGVRHIHTLVNQNGEWKIATEMAR